MKKRNMYYTVMSIGDHQIEYPDAKEKRLKSELEKLENIEGRSIIINQIKEQLENLRSSKAEFENLSEYLKIAKKSSRSFLRKFMSSEDINKLVNKSEDFVSFIAYAVMMADWRYEKGKSKGKTRRSYRNQCVLYAIKDYFSSLKNVSNSAIPVSVLSNEENSDDVTFDIPYEDEEVENIDVQTRKQKYVHYLIQSAELSPIQKKCIDLYYLQGIDSYEEVGKRFDPPISKQAVGQDIERAISNIRKIAQP